MALRKNVILRSPHSGRLEGRAAPILPGQLAHMIKGEAMTLATAEPFKPPHVA